MNKITYGVQPGVVASADSALTTANAEIALNISMKGLQQ